MTDGTGDFGTKTKRFRCLLLPTGNRLSRGQSIEHRVSFDCGQATAIEVQEFAWRRMRREKISDPFLVAPHWAANVEHVEAPFYFLVASYQATYKLLFYFTIDKLEKMI